MPLSLREHRVGLLAAAVAVAVLLIVALRSCGDDRLSERELRAEAAAICLELVARTDRIALPNGPADGARFLAEGVAILRPSVDRLRALKAPEALRDRYERAVARDQAAVTLIARYQREISREGDAIPRFRALHAELEPILDDGNTLWESLDIPACIRR